MESQKTFSSKNNNTILLYIILGAAIFFILILPVLNNRCEKELQENLDNVVGGASNSPQASRRLDLNKCSRQCCKQTQWQLPGALQATGPIPQEELKNYIGSNFSCSGDSTGPSGESGCVCFTKDDFNYLRDHAGNGTPL
jgi:hypothetical protein